MDVKICDMCGKVVYPWEVASIHIAPSDRHPEDIPEYGFHGDFCEGCFRKLAVGIAEMMLRRISLEETNGTD